MRLAYLLSWASLSALGAAAVSADACSRCGPSISCSRTTVSSYVQYGSSSGSGASRGVAYAEALAGVPLGASVYKRTGWGNQSKWTIVLRWKLQR